jgi:Holliday junction resolvasome RuvABC endonuclease subunit
MILGIDPGFAHCGIALVEWHPRARRLAQWDCIDTKPDTAGELRFATIIERLDAWMTGVDLVVIEDMRGVRHGKNREHAAGAHDDPVLGIMWAAMALAARRGIPVRLVQPQSSTAAVGVRKLVRTPGETEHKFKARRKAETERAVRVLLERPIDMPVDCFDAAAHAIAGKIGKGRAW